MPYTDLQMKNFTQVAYADLADAYTELRIKHPGKTSFTIAELKEVAEKFGNDVKSLNVLSDEELDTWKISGVHDTNSENGFYACIIETEPGKAAVGFRGSESLDDPSNLYNDWIKADFGLLNSTCTNQQEEVERFLDKYKEQLSDYESLAMTGHSLGGNLAEYATIISSKYGLDDDITQCISMDGPGFSNEFINKYQSEIQNMSGVMKHYRWSLVGGLLFDLPGVEYKVADVTNTDNNDLFCVFRHDTKYVNFDENGNIKPGKQDELSIISALISKTFDMYNPIIGFPSIILPFAYGISYIINSDITDKIVNGFKDFINYVTGNTVSDYLRVNMYRLRYDAESLQCLINQIIDQTNGIYDEVNVLGTMWKGSASNAFSQSFANEYEEISTYLKKVKTYIEKIEHIENAYSRCEQSVLQMIDSIHING